MKLVCRFIDFMRRIFGCCDSTNVKNLRQGTNLCSYGGCKKDALEVFKPLIDADKLKSVRWVSSTGDIKELYYTTFQTPQWVNEIGNLKTDEVYIIFMKSEHKGFEF